MGTESDIACVYHDGRRRDIIAFEREPIGSRDFTLKKAVALDSLAAKTKGLLMRNFQRKI